LRPFAVQEHPIREGVKFQLRFEGYNAFNDTQFSGLNTAAKFDLQGNQVSQNSVN
jgi:hypothetical protein